MRLSELILAVVTVVAFLPGHAANADDSTSLSGSHTEAAAEGRSHDESAYADPGRDALTFAPTYLVGEILSLQLSRARNQGVVINEDTGDTLLSTGDLRYRLEPGVRVTMGVSLSERTTLEASYFGLPDWTARRTVEGDDNLSLPGDIAQTAVDFLDADQMSVLYLSELHNFEINLVRPVGGSNLALLAGFRYVGLRERFDINSFDADSGRSDYDIHSEAHLFGAQIGGRLQRQYGQFGLDFIGKAGIFGNDAGQHTLLGDSNNTVIVRDSITHRVGAAFVGEIGLTGKVQLNPRWCLRGGYSALWLEGVVRAPDQLDFTDTATSGTALIFGSAFLHGPNIGLEAQW
jgi:hypothetical protein